MIIASGGQKSSERSKESVCSEKRTGTSLEKVTVEKETVNLDDTDEGRETENGNANTEELDAVADNIMPAPSQLVLEVNLGEQHVNDNHSTKSNDSSDDSEYVEATQNDQEQDSDHEDIPIQETPERIQNDMEFLNISWGNLADQEKEELDRRNKTEEQALIESQRLIEEALRIEDEQNINDAGFQLVRSKEMKKTQHAGKSNAGKSYTTRSKGGNSKPFR